MLVLALGAGCGDDVDDDCLTHANPSFELGTGVGTFEPLTDGQDLHMAAGLQGGCHFWLSLRTDGFSASGFTVTYDILYAESGESTGNTASVQARLSERGDAPGLCEHVGLSAFLEQPWRFEDQQVRIDVTLADADGRAATVSRKVIARWPEDGPGGDRTQWCGFRE